MNTFGIIYIILGIVATIGCILDGPDVKQALQNYFGDKCYDIGKRFVPQKFYVPMPEPIYIEQTNFDADKISARVMMSELEEYQHKQMFGDVSQLEQYKQDKLILDIIRRVEKYITIEKYKDPYTLNTTIEGYLYVGKKR